MKVYAIIAWSLLLLFGLSARGQEDSSRSGSTPTPVIKIDLSKSAGPMQPIWAWFGYDEPNYTYMKDGKKLLSELAALSKVPVYVRTHCLLCSGDGTPALKW